MRFSKERAPYFISRYAFLVGLFNVLANTLRPFKSPAQQINHYFLYYVNSTAFATTVLSGFALLLVSRGLKRKKKRAWNLTMVILIANLISDLFRFHRHPIQVALSILLIVSLAFFKEEFYAKSDSSTKWQPLLGLALALPTVIILGILLIYFRHSDSLNGSPSLWEVVQTVLAGMVGLTGPAKFSSERITDTVGFTLGTFGAFTVLFPLWLYLRRVKGDPLVKDADISHIKEIIFKDEFSDSLSYFATRKDKKIIWSKNMKAGLAYRVENGVALVSGDPFGEFSLWPEVIENFQSHVAEYAWTPAVLGATDRAGELWIEKGGMTAIDIGDEAIVNVPEFTLEGRPIKNVREAVKKMTRLGYQTQTLKASELSEGMRAELRLKAREWRYGAPERGFSMALDRFLDDRDGETVITIASKEGSIQAFLSFVPWGKNKLSLDRMQRSKECESGINEFLIAQTVEYGKSAGIKEISLNFAAFKSVFERADKISAGPVVRLKRNFLRFMSNWFQVESLYRFNAKFQPEWRTRYLMVPQLSAIIPVTFAAAKAERFIGSGRLISQHEPAASL